LPHLKQSFFRNSEEGFVLAKTMVTRLRIGRDHPKLEERFATQIFIAKSLNETEGSLSATSRLDRLPFYRVAQA
jgi:hypothetical protein